MKTAFIFPKLCGNLPIPILLLTATALANPPASTNHVQLGFTVPASIMVQTGQVVVLSLTNATVFTPPPDYSGPVYQWIKDGVLIDGATNQDLTISPVGMDDVGAYTAFIAGFYARSESTPVFLSVYSLVPTNSNWGSMGVPVSQFSFLYNTLPCSGKQFDSFLAEFPFYGPNTPAQQPPFTNSSNSSFLDISTCTSANGSTLDTGILVKENTKPPPSPLIVGCSDDMGSACSGNSGLSFCTVPLKSGMLYRVGLYFNSASLQGLTKLTFTWYYHN